MVVSRSVELNEYNINQLLVRFGYCASFYLLFISYLFEKDFAQQRLSGKKPVI